MMMNTTTVKGTQNVRITLAFYLVLGFVHEITHLFAGWILGVWRPNQEEALSTTLGKAFLGRACAMSASFDSAPDDNYALLLVRHAGWMVSLGVALVIHLVAYHCRNNATLSAARTAAWITCMEALCTDLLGIGGVAASSDAVLFYCGNFGFILLDHLSWIDLDKGRTAMDMLERMVYMTMVRGAQSGGVITWTTASNGKDFKGIRSRVVNGKRTDLSKRLRRKVEQDCTRIACGGKFRPGIQAFLGHTRFATSSKATFDGTHPHQWTPPQLRRVYRLDQESVLKSSRPIPESVMVEHFVTHNGDFDFFVVNETHYDLETVQQWLMQATGSPMPTTVDSAAIAGMIDLLRTAGCFGLSVRFTLLLNCKSSRMETEVTLPSYEEFEELGTCFEDALISTCQENNVTLGDIKSTKGLKQIYATSVVHMLRTKYFADKTRSALANLINLQYDVERGDKASLTELVNGTIDAFFGNNLFQATRIFMQHAKGSFGLMVSSSLDAHRQICLAARGQPMSIAFYPKSGLICYASERTVIQVGLNVKAPGSQIRSWKTRHGTTSHFSAHMRNVNETEDTCRLDLDDLGGEVALLDWSRGSLEDPDKSYLELMRSGTVDIMVSQESKTTTSVLSKRLFRLEKNEFIRPLQTDSPDPVLNDIRDIPGVCKSIQDSWKVAGLNRCTAWNLVRRIKKRLNDRMSGRIPSNCGALDILLTGCEVSLWVAEQFAADLRKAFTNLNVQAISSNKLLAVFGQDPSIPMIGFPISEKTLDLKQTIVIIVSHSGQTFGPLACSSLLQSFTRDLFVVTSEWDTQIGKQLCTMWKDDDDIFSSRIFATEVGVRPAEPCSISVVATHQLLTQLFMHVSIALLSDSKIRRFCGAVVTEYDLRVLARCNVECIRALEDIVGTTVDGQPLANDSETESHLRRAGNKWSEHVLEYPKAYAITFVYVIGTVTAGYPFITGMAIVCGLDSGWGLYICRFLDGWLYFFFLQLTIFVIRMVQGRDLRHRTVGRTVLIGDCPWVAQSADAFLSKLFACSYPIAGLNVLHGNPADHLLHRHTHRVVRGSLFLCGRPDGRLTALTNAEASVSLSIKQASSIQSLGGTCETITIGHNPSTLSLTSKDIFLGNHRPAFLCERVIGDLEQEEKSIQMLKKDSSRMMTSDNALDNSSSSHRQRFRQISARTLTFEGIAKPVLERSTSDGKPQRTRSVRSLYMTLRQLSEKETTEECPEYCVIEEMIREHMGRDIMRQFFDEMDPDGNDSISVDDFVNSYADAHPGLTDQQVRQVVVEAGVGLNGRLDFDDFVIISKLPDVELVRTLMSAPRDSQGFLQVHPSEEVYFGEELQKLKGTNIGAFALSQSQHFAMELYESRVASLERFVSMCVMFHQMGSRVQKFFSKWSLGLLGYRMDRTQSMLRIATTASPVSGADVRERMETLKLRAKIQNSLRVISSAWYRHIQAEVQLMKSSRRQLLRPDTETSDAEASNAEASDAEASD